MTDAKPYSLTGLLKAKPKDSSAATMAQVDAAAERQGFTVRDPAAPVDKPKRGAPVRVTRQNAKRVSIELDGEDFKRLQLLGVERGEKLQTMCERAILDYLKKYANSKTPK